MEWIPDPLAAIAEFVQVNISLATERDLNKLLTMIVSCARRLTGAEVGRIFVLDRTMRVLCLEVTQNARVNLTRSDLDDVPLRTADGPNTRHVCAYCAFSGRLVNIADVYATAGFDFTDLYRSDQLHRYRTRSLITVPLRGCEETTNGVLQLANRRARGDGAVIGFDEALEGLIRAFAAQAAVAIDNVKLLDEKRRLIEVLDNSNRTLRQENERLRANATRGPERAGIIGDSPGMKRLFGLLDKIADSDVTVLIRGETGTGKELIARTIYQNSKRRGRPFVAQNCAAVPAGLLESELFGYRRGAFTGAVGDKRGLFEQADGGTLFLDEIGDLPLELQAKLLRVLQEGEIRPLGSVENRRVDVRIIAATHRDLEARIDAGDFRQDLYYRLMVFPVEIPPLRERRADLPALVDHFILAFASRYNKGIKGIAPDALRLLLEHDYPGNVRELQNQIERAVLLAEPAGPVLTEHLPMLSRSRASSLEDELTAALGGGLKEVVCRYEARVIESHLRANNWNQTRTAELLGLPRRTLLEKISRYRIERPGG